jgi:kinesin family protein 15
MGVVQTGSGKTHTMLGDIKDVFHQPSDDRGMTPRIFEYLFARIIKVEFFCGCLSWNRDRV